MMEYQAPAGTIQLLAGDQSSVVFTILNGATTTMTQADVSWSAKKPLDVPTSEAPAMMVLDATNVYWPDTFGMLLWRSPRDGSKAVQLAPLTHPAAAVAVDSTYVYWSDPMAKTISRVAIAGGAAAKVTDASANGLYVDAKAIYWTDLTGGKVMKLAL
jgi:hypothetical protein